jgi:hypothetical protein
VGHGGGFMPEWFRCAYVFVIDLNVQYVKEAKRVQHRFSGLFASFGIIALIFIYTFHWLALQKTLLRSALTPEPFHDDGRRVAAGLCCQPMRGGRHAKCLRGGNGRWGGAGGFIVQGGL